MAIRICPANAQGFGLAESLISVAFTGMAIAGAFSVSLATASSSSQTALRQELLYMAEDMFEHMRLDRENIDDYAFSLGLTSAQCEALEQPVMTTAQDARLSWCRRLGAIAAYRAGEGRTVRIDAPDAGTRIVEIALQASIPGGGMRQEFIAKRIFEAPPAAAAP